VVNIWQRYRQSESGTFFGTVYTPLSFALWRTTEPDWKFRKQYSASWAWFVL